MKIIFQKKNFFFFFSKKQQNISSRYIKLDKLFLPQNTHGKSRNSLVFASFFLILCKGKLLTLKSLVFNEFLCRTSLSFYFIFPLEKFTVLFAINFLARQKQSEMKIKTSHKSARRFFEGKRRQPKILITNFSN